MSDFLLSVMPGLMAKYDYARALLKWAEQSVDEIKAHHKKSTIGYPVMEPLLLSSLEKVSHDIGLVPLLQFVIKLKKLNARLKKTNANTEDTGGVLDTYFALEDDMPQLDAELKRALTIYAAKAILFFAVLVVVIVGSLFALVRCA